MVSRVHVKPIHRRLGSAEQFRLDKLICRDRRIKSRTRTSASNLVALPKNNSIAKSLSFERILEVIWFKLKHQEISKADAIKAIALFLNIPIPNLIGKESSSLSYLVKSKTDVMNIYKCNKPELHSYNLISLLINPPVATLKKHELALIRELRYRNNLELAVAALTRRGQYIYKPISVDKDFKLEVLPFEKISTDDVCVAAAWKAFDYETILPKIWAELESKRLGKDTAMQILYSLFELKPNIEETNIPTLLLYRLYEAKRGPLILRLWPDSEIACAELVKLVVDTPIEFQDDPLIIELKTGNNLELAIRALRTNIKYEPNASRIRKFVHPDLEVFTAPEPATPKVKQKKSHPLFDIPEPISEKMQAAPTLIPNPKPDATISRGMYLECLLADLEAKDFNPEKLWQDYYKSVKDDHMTLLRDATSVIKQYNRRSKAANASDRVKRLKVLNDSYIQLYSYLQTDEAVKAPEIWRACEGWYLKAFEG